MDIPLAPSLTLFPFLLMPESLNMPPYLPNIFMICMLRVVIKLQWVMIDISFQLTCIARALLLRWVILLWLIFGLNDYPTLPQKAPCSSYGSLPDYQEVGI